MALVERWEKLLAKLTQLKSTDPQQPAKKGDLGAIRLLKKKKVKKKKQK